MIEGLVEQIEARYADVQEQMSDPEVIGDRKRYADAGRLFNQLAPAAKLAEEWRLARSDAEGAQEMLDEGGEDPEMREELNDARERIERLEEEIRLAMVERDPNDDKNVIVEIRGGAGGEEAGLWAGDLYRMLTRYAERRGFPTETMDASDGSYTFEVKGDGAFSVFKFEGGTHRVQRVPETESQGRIHTSTATVAVLPEAEDVDVEIDQNDLQIDVYRSSGPGGQSVNTTDSAVRITHKPTGHRRLDAGREVPAAEPRARVQGAARAALRGQGRRAAGRAGRRPPLAGRHRRARGEDPHLQLPRAARDRPPRQAHRPQPRRAARRASWTRSRPRCRTPRSARGSSRPPPPSFRSMGAGDEPRMGGAARAGAGLVAARSPWRSRSRRAHRTTHPAGEAGSSIATGGSGGVYQVYGGGLAEVLTDELPDSPTTAETTSASVDNLLLVADGESDIAFTLGDTAIDAVRGDEAFPREEPLRALGTLYPNITQVVVKADSGIESIEDLKDKTVSVGAPNSGTEIIALRMMEVAGPGPRRGHHKRGLGVGESAQAIRDGSIDAFFWSGGVPTGAITDLATTDDIRLLPTDEYLDGLRDEVRRGLPGGGDRGRRVRRRRRARQDGRRAEPADGQRAT